MSSSDYGEEEETVKEWLLACGLLDPMADCPLPELVPSVYPTDYVPDADWVPTKEQRTRLRYWNYFTYWVEQSLRKQVHNKEKVAD